MSKTLAKAVKYFSETSTGSTMNRLDGFDSELLAVVVEEVGITIYQSYDEDTEPERVFLPDDCYEGLLKILQEQLALKNVKRGVV